MGTFDLMSGCHCPPELTVRLMAARPQQAPQFGRDLKRLVRAAFAELLAP
jgi:hypothetical protein